MKPLNCRIGDLAILTQGVVPKNSESFVRVVGSYGYMDWPGFLEKTFVWKVELNSSGQLFYERDDGLVELLKEGPAPDVFLLPVPDPASEAIESCLAQHPNLSREDAFQMARDFGFI
jgi:hypothetical protein